jgi:phage-related protein
VRDVIHGWPLQVKKELGSVLTRLQKGESIGMPDVRPTPDIGSQASEIRIPDRSGTYRALYAIRMESGILLFHAFQKKTLKTPEREKKTARRRLEAFLKELEDER